MSGRAEVFDPAILDVPLLSRHVRVGGCRVLRKLADSDEGSVYEAEQEDGEPRQVALLIAESVMEGSQVVARFEQDAVERLDHPAIAASLGAGITDDGRAFFVMERVSGPPITEYCDSEGLDVRGRLELFVRVCDAVQHAHDRGMLHRDLRPSNVRVVPEDGEPGVKITGIGLAQATARRLTERTRFAERGAIFGAPEWMSPEQAAGRAVDGRTDVFSLGLLLYELLVGALPFDRESMRRAGLDELRRRIREEQPVRPSTRLVELGELAQGSARRRGVRPRALVRLLRGELDRIALRAIEREPSRRFATPGELGDRLGEYLRGESGKNRRPRALPGLLSRLAAHRVALVAIGVLATVVVVGKLALDGGRIVWPFSERSAERRGTAGAADSPEHDSAVAEQVSSFLRGLFELEDRDAAGLTGSEILDRAAERLEGELLDRPGIRVRLMVTLGESYRRLGNHDRAEAMLGRGLAGTKDLLGADHPETLRAMGSLAALFESQGRFDDAERLRLQLVESRRRSQGGEHPDTLTSLAGLAGVYRAGGSPGKAEPLYREVLETRVRVLGEDHADTIQAMVELGEFYRAEGQTDRFEGMCLRILEARRRLLGRDHPDTLASLLDLTALYREQGRPNEAASLQRETLDALGRLHGSDDARTLAAIDALAGLYVAAERYEEAEPLVREARETRRRVLGDGHPGTLTSTVDLAALYLRQGRYGQAEPLLARAVRDARQALPGNHLVTGMALKAYGSCLLGTQRFNEAEEALLDAYEILKTVLGPEHEETVQTIGALVDLYNAAGAPRMAAAWRARLPG